MNIRLAVIVLTLIAFPGALQGQTGFSKGGSRMGQASVESGGPNTITPSGLRPAYPGEARCPEIASPYGSRTRYDGSSRPTWAPGGGYHGGIDISLPEDVPLLALAAGTVAAKGEGGMLEGIYLWLKHAPEDTGLSYWVFSKYQHLLVPPELEVGARVALGQVVARSGKTGTVGGKHYGMAGYPHLHLTTRKGARGDETITEGALFDPLAVYHEAGTKGRGPAEPPLPEGAVPIPYATPDGKIASAGTRVVWPVACQPK